MTAPGNPESQVPEKPVSKNDSLGKDPRPATAHVLQNLRELLRVAKCPNCDGSGAIPVPLGEHFVTDDMASDAGEPSMAGQSMGIEWGTEQCQWCDERETLLETSVSESVGSPADGVAAEGGLIKLNQQQEQIIKEWAADSPHGDLWGNDEARNINLHTFARSILAASLALPKPETEQGIRRLLAINDELWTECTVQWRHDLYQEAHNLAKELLVEAARLVLDEEKKKGVVERITEVVQHVHHWKPEASSDNVSAVLQKTLTALEQARVYVSDQNDAEGMLEGFGPRVERPSDVLLMKIDATTIELRLLLSEHLNDSGALPVPENSSSLVPLQEAQSRPVADTERALELVPCARRDILEAVLDHGPNAATLVNLRLEKFVHDVLSASSKASEENKMESGGKDA